MKLAEVVAGSICTKSSVFSFVCSVCLFKPFFFNSLKFYIHLWFACLYVCAPHAYLVPTGVTRGHWIHGTGVMDGSELP